MNNNYMSNNNYRQMSNTNYDTQSNVVNTNIFDQIYIDTFLKNKEGKFVKVYITVPGSSSWQDKLFEGVIENVGSDHVILSNTSTGEKYLIPLIYIVFISYN